MPKTMENEMEAGLHGGFRGTIYNVVYAPCMIIVWGTSSRIQNDVGNCLGPYGRP